jgi:hypothetical protein
MQELLSPDSLAAVSLLDLLIGIEPMLGIAYSLVHQKFQRPQDRYDYLTKHSLEDTLRPSFLPIELEQQFSLRQRSHVLADRAELAAPLDWKGAISLASLNLLVAKDLAAACSALTVCAVLRSRYSKPIGAGISRHCSVSCAGRCTGA